MKRLTLNQKGSSHIVAVLAVVVVAAVAFAGYRVMQNNNNDSANTNATTQSAVPSTLNSANDVRKASRSLDDQSIDGQVNPNKLDSDLSAML